MAWTRQTLQALREQIADDIERHAPDVDAHQKGSVENAIAIAQAGAMHMAYGALEYYVKQLFDDTAEDEFIFRRAAPYGVTRIGAKPATGNITITGNNGASVPAGTELSASDGQTYTTDALATIAAGTATVAVTGVLQTKADSEELDGVGTNQNAGTTLTFNSPPANIDPTATVAAGGLTGGADIESIARFKERFEERKKTPPRGGSKPDYIAWAKQASADVTRVFVVAHKDPALATEYGSVLVYPVTDDLASPIPDAGLLTTVSDYIEQDDVRPVGAKNIYVEALTPVNLDMTFSALEPNTAAVQAAIEAEVQDLLVRKSEPGATIYLSQIREAISNAAGEEDFTLTSPAADIVLAENELLVLGTTTWPGA